MNKFTTEEKVKVVACFVEGNSLRATVRMTGVHRTTIQKLLVELGAACSAYQDKTFVNLKSNWSSSVTFKQGHELVRRAQAHQQQTRVNRMPLSTVCTAAACLV